MEKTLVTYFSASGVTKKLAELIQKELCCDIYEIKPEEEYTKKDLNWLNPFSRTTKEMHNKSFRPPIINDGNVEEYDLIFLGFPIWWYIAPTIINTYLESMDFSGKKIITFATSGSSGMGKSLDLLKQSSPGAVFVEGKVINKADSDKVKTFLKEIIGEY